MKRLFAALLLPGLVACASAPKKAAPAAQVPAATVATPAATASASPAPRVSPYAPAQEDPNTRGHYTAGGLYRPGVPDSTPDYVPDVDRIPEPEVTAEPRSKVGNRATYSVLGKQYHVLADHTGYAEQGLASYYGSKFHGRRTSNLEVYDMNAFTAAHKTLPLPSFARVTNLDNGKSVVVRVNDRGPFHDGRIVDLSYAAAVKLGITQRGTGRVEVRALVPGEDATSYAKAATPPQRASTMDNLLAVLPVASAATFELPPGVRIATGKPTRLNVPAAATVPVIAAPTPAAPMTAVGAPASAPVSAQPPVAAPDWRFDMHQNGRTMTADEFDAWMKTRQVRVATGQPGTPVTAMAAPAVTSPPVAATPTTATITGAAPARPANASSADAIMLQVASFSARGNADRALAMLHGAGIGQARLMDGNANGQQVWRLRVGPLDAASAPQLASRIAGLGFGPPQRVRD